MNRRLPDYQQIMDKRILERKRIDPQELQSYLDTLPDLADNATAVVIEDDDEGKGNP